MGTIKHNLSKEGISNQVAQILKDAPSLDFNLLKELHGFIDFTSLNSHDSVGGIEEFIEEINNFSEINSSIPSVAAICVYPNFVKTVRGSLDVEEINIASVAGFPSSQTFFSIKFAEAKMAVERGAEEVDLVLPLAKFFDMDYEEVHKEISVTKELLKDVILKVILETGVMRNNEDIYTASMLALEAGADFIKTSTGKEKISATPEAFYVMALAVKDYHLETKQKKGIKVAGGISTSENAILYYTIVKEVLGEEWLTKDLFRIGSSRLSDNLIMEISDFV